MKQTIEHKETQLPVKAWRAATLEHALDDCSKEEYARLTQHSTFKGLAFQDKHGYAKSADSFIVINGLLFWIFLDESIGLEVLHRYDPMSSDMITDEPCCFISQRVGALAGPCDSDGSLLTFRKDKRTRLNFAGAAFLTTQAAAKELGFVLSKMVCTIN